MPVIVAENDPIIRNIQVVLDPDTPADRQDAIADYFSVDLPDFHAWRDELRTRVPSVFPAEFRMADDVEALRAALPDAVGAIVEGMKFGAAELDCAPNLKIVQKFGADLRNVDVAACAARGVPVQPLRRRVNGAVAEHVFALMLALAKKICEIGGRIDPASLEAMGYSPRLYDSRHCGRSNWGRIAGLGTLEGATLGAVGLGEIGRELAKRASAFGMDVLYFQRRQLPEDVERAHGARYCGFEELLKRSDYVSVQLPSNKETRNMIDAAAFRRMKPGAVLINVSRAEIIDRTALIEALESGHLGGAGLDVFWEEPAAANDPLTRFPNVVITPHTAVAARWNGARDVEEAVLNFAEAIG